MNLRRRARDYGIAFLIFAAVVVIYNALTPRTAEDRAYQAGIAWAEAHPEATVNDCPRDQSNPFWFGCTETIDRR